MWADHHTLIALDADGGIPGGYLHGDIAFFPPGGSCRPATILGESAHRHEIPETFHDAGSDTLHEVGRLGRNGGWTAALGGDMFRNGDFAQGGERLIHGGEIALDDFLAFFLVTLADRILDARDGLLLGKDAGDGKEAGLHDGIDPPPHACIAGHAVAVNAVETDAFGYHLLLKFQRKPIPHRLGGVGGIEQEHGPLGGAIEHRQLIQERPLVAGDKAGLADQIRGTDRFRPESEVGNGDGSRLLGVIHEISLGIIRGLTPDDLDGVFVRSNRAIRSQTIENRPSRR